MAKYTFVTESHAFGDEKKTVEVLTRTEIKKIVAEAIAREAHAVLDRMDSLDRKLAKEVDQASVAGKDASAAREEVGRLAETARETFRDVIEELLEPHYKRLAEHLGVKSPPKEEKARPVAKGKASPRKKLEPAASPKETATKTTKCNLKGTKPCRRKS